MILVIHLILLYEKHVPIVVECTRVFRGANGISIESILLKRMPSGYRQFKIIGR